MRSHPPVVALAAFLVLLAVHGAAGQSASVGEEVEAALRKELAYWYPASIDTARGGYRWPSGEDNGSKMIVYQARQLWAAAEVMRRRPELAEAYRPYVEHGVRFLRETMWDDQRGGFYWELYGEGNLAPGVPEQKHSYGNAFGIYAAANAHRATGDPGALDLAIDGYRWLEEHARDPEHPGYYEAFALDGTPLMASPDGNPKQGDLIGTAFGFKSMNTHLHLLEAYTALYEVWPDEGLRGRLEELFTIMRDRVQVRGTQHLYFTPDWRPVPDHDSYGHDVEAAFLLLEAAHALGRGDDPETHAVARQLVDHALDWGFDAEHGGLYYAGPTFGEPFNTRKDWWVQAEALNALSLMDSLYGDETDRYREAFEQTWAFIRDRQIDPQTGGWLQALTAAGEPVSDSLVHNWKTAYHTSRAMLLVADRLRADEPTK